MTVQVSPARPQPRSSSNRPASMYMTASWSGMTSRPCRSVSSPVLTMTVRSPGGRTAWRPWASFAPPVPPARATTYHSQPLYALSALLFLTKMKSPPVSARSYGR